MKPNWTNFQVGGHIALKFDIFLFYIVQIFQKMLLLFKLKRFLYILRSNTEHQLCTLSVMKIYAKNSVKKIALFEAVCLPVQFLTVYLLFCTLSKSLIFLLSRLI